MRSAKRATVLTASAMSVLSVGILTSVFVLQTTPSSSEAMQADDVRCYVPTTSVLADVNPNAGTDVNTQNIGLTISTFGIPLPYSISRSELVDDLDLGVLRVPVYWDSDTSLVMAGVPKSAVGETYDATELTNFAESTNSQIMAVIIGDNGDLEFSPEDAANVVSTLAPLGVKMFALGNEPGNFPIQLTASETVQFFNERVAAMREVDSAILIGGPNWAWYEPEVLQQFAAQADYDFISFHGYAMGASDVPIEEAMAQTSQWATNIEAVQGWMAQAGKTDPKRNFVVVGELNWSWRYDPSSYVRGDAFFSQDIVAWSTSVLGGIFEVGGRAIIYADQNGPIGVVSQPDLHSGDAITYETHPLYYGIAAWTGGGKFPGPGPESKIFQVDKTGTDAVSVEVFALSNKDGGINLVVVNKSDHEAYVRVAGEQIADRNWDRYNVTRSGIEDGDQQPSCGPSVPMTAGPKSVTVLVSQ